MEDKEFLGAPRHLGADITRYLVARYQITEKLIPIDAAEKPQLHIHEE